MYISKFRFSTFQNLGYFPEAVLQFITNVGGGFIKTEDQGFSLEDLTKQVMPSNKMNSFSSNFFHKSARAQFYFYFINIFVSYYYDIMYTIFLNT